MAVNLINGNDTQIVKTNDDIQVEFSQSKNQQIENIEAAIDVLKSYNVFSTNEIKIGEMDNGESVYGKLIRFDSTNFTNNVNLETGITNLDEVIFSSCSMKSTQDNGWRNIPWLYGSGTSNISGSWAGGFFVRETGQIFFQLGNDLQKLSKVIVIVVYTKTTG